MFRIQIDLTHSTNQLHIAAAMDALTQQTDALSLTAAAATAAGDASPSSPAVAFLLHVLDMSSVTEDAPIELREDAPNYIALRWSEQEVAEANANNSSSGSSSGSGDGLTIAQVKHELARARYIAAQDQKEEQVAAGADVAAASEKKVTAPLHLDDMRLVYLTQRAVSASSSGSSNGSSGSAALSTCRPLTDLSARSSLQQLGVASGSWILLKRRFVPTRNVEEEEEEEEEYEDEQYYEDESETKEEEQQQQEEQVTQQEDPSAEESTAAVAATDVDVTSSSIAPIDASLSAPSSSLNDAATSASSASAT